MSFPRSILPFLLAATAAVAAPTAPTTAPAYDLLIRNGTIYDGSGRKPYRGEVAIRSERIAYVGPKAPGRAAAILDAKGQAVAPGFINMLAHPEETLMVDGRALSDLKQGVTLEVMGELSMGPLSPEMQKLAKQRQGDLKYEVSWSTLGGYLETLEKKGIAPNVASFVGAGTVRVNVLGENNVAPDATQLGSMKKLVREAMEQGALGVTTALIYAPESYASTAELIALATESARCGGLYSAHMRSEGDKIEAALDETIRIARESGGPAEVYHLKLGGKGNWHKLDAVVKTIEAARKQGVSIAANMYNYTAGATGFDAAMPPWIQEGGVEAWVARLRDPALRAKAVREMREPSPGWENLYAHAGPEGTLLLQFTNDALKPLIGKTLAEVARQRGKSPEETIAELVMEDGSRVGVAYFLMSEDNVRRQIKLPWVSFGSDEGGHAPQGVFLKFNPHPRAYGNFARLLGKYVREEKLIPLEAAIHRLTAFPADRLFLKDRGRLKAGQFADVVVFDPATIADKATFAAPHQLAVGVSQVLVNGRFALKDGEPTGAATGRVVRGRGWTGHADGGCRASAADWKKG